jgi:hypothetical protein
MQLVFVISRAARSAYVFVVKTVETGTAYIVFLNKMLFKRKFHHHHMARRATCKAVRRVFFKAAAGSKTLVATRANEER